MKSDSISHCILFLKNNDDGLKKEKEVVSKR